MITWLKRITTLPSIEDNDRARRARLLYLITWATLAITLVYSALWPIVQPQRIRRLVYLPVVLVILLVTIILIRRGQLNWASLVFHGGGWVAITLITIGAGGTRAPFFSLYTLAVMGAALFSGWSVALVFALLSLLAGLGMVYLDSLGRVPAPIATPLSAWLSQFAIMCFITIDAYIAIRGADRALHHARQELAERQRTEHALRESETRYRVVSELISDYAFAYDITSEGTLAPNWITEDSFVRLTGYPVWSEIGATFRLYHPDDEALARQHVQDSIQGQPSAGEYRILTKSGQQRWIYLRRHPVWNKDEKRVTRIYGIAQDITERKQAEQEIRALNIELEQRVAQRTAQLEATNKELEAFAYSLSHDLRAPLRSLDGFSQALLEDYGRAIDETGQDYLNRIRAASQRMGEMIDAMLMLSRVTRSELKVRPVDLSRMAAEILGSFAEAEPDRHVEVIIMPGVQAQCDARLIQIVLQNLLQNAWKYTGQQPQARIEFGCRCGEGETVYFVTDNGVGFDMIYVNKLFTSFQRLHTAEAFPGIGIGLVTVQRIIHRHGGRIWATAAAGQGATFCFTLTSG